MERAEGSIRVWLPLAPPTRNTERGTTATWPVGRGIQVAANLLVMASSACVVPSPQNHIGTSGRLLARDGASGSGGGGGGLRSHRWRGHVSGTDGVRPGHVDSNNQFPPWTERVTSNDRFWGSMTVI